MTVLLERGRLLIVSILLLAQSVLASIDFVDLGGIPEDSAPETCAHNTQLLNNVLQYNLTDDQTTLQLVRRNQTIYFHPGIVGRWLTNVRILLDGTMRFQRPPESESSEYHLDDDADVKAATAPCWLITDSTYVTISSSSFFSWNESSTRNNHTQGLIDGQGSQYWGFPYIGFLQTRNDRPKLLHLQNSSHVEIQHVILQDCPMECLVLDDIDHALVRNMSIVVRRTNRRTHEFVDLSAFGTKGVVIKSSDDINVQDVDVWTQDDCISVQDGSNNVILQGVNASGMGISVSSSGGPVGNISLLNSRLYHSIRGLALKFYDSASGGSIEHVYVENVTMEAISQWPLWFGPAQQASEDNACQANPCSLCWPQFLGSSCKVVSHSVLKNVTLRNVQINNPRLANGVLLSDASTATLDNILFDSVRVTKGAPLTYTNKDLRQTFPGLMQRVHDAYVPNEDGWLKKTKLLAARKDDTGWLEDYHGYELPSQEFLGLKIVERLEILVGTCLCALSLVILTVLCVRLQCRDEEDELPLSDEDQLVMADGIHGFSNGQHDISRDIASSDIFSDEFKTDDPLDDGLQLNAGEKMDQPLLSPPLDRLRSPMRSRRVSRSCQVAPYHVMALLAAIYGLLVGLSYLVTFPGRPLWEKTNQFYMCEGVTNGVAKGNTWPVPYCFLNETKWFSWTQLYDHISSLLHAHFVLAACILTFVSLYIHFSFLFKERTDRNALASFGNQAYA
jgi:hypothetical protein